MLVLVLIITIIYIYFLQFYNIEENFEEDIDRYYFSSYEAGNIFSNQSDIISYIHHQRKIERTVKGYSKFTADNIKLYQSNFLNFKSEEKNHIDSLLKIICSNFKNNYKKFNYDKWLLIKSNDKIEGGMPFTISDYIILPEKVIEKSMFMNNLKSSMEYLGNILIHEKMHIYQRNYPHIMNNFYKKYWHFTYIPNIIIPNYINDKIRSNPDGIEVNWVYKNKYLILSLLNNRNDLSSIDIKFYPINYVNGNYHLGKPTDSLYEYNKFFCNIRYPYHPNESAAYLFSDIILAQIFNEKLDVTCPAIKAFHQWLNKYMR